MGFASSYLDKHRQFKPFTDSEPKRGTSLIVVIPSFSEPDVLTSLISLNNADRPSYPVEVIVVINSPEGSDENITEQNRKSLLQVRQWSRRSCTDDFRVHVLDVPPFPLKHAGAGFARKTGMDEALHRFNLLNNEKGIIVSFDADSTCDRNYFTELEKCFSVGKPNGCTIYFEHPLSRQEHFPQGYHAIAEYELYLRYFVQAMRMSGFPYSFHTIGSCFAVNSKIYAAQGGMNRKRAGEDFYFLHKIFRCGNFTELNTTRVVPSSRVSERVPFGTGATMRKFYGGCQSALYTYPLKSFDELSALFSVTPDFYGASEKKIISIAERLPCCLGSYLRANNFVSSVQQMNIHSASLQTFRKRFFVWFNALRLLKFLNYARENCRENQPVTLVARDLLKRLEIKPVRQAEGILMQYRLLQRNITWKC